MFIQQSFTTMHGTILCSRYSVLLQCMELSYVRTTAFYYNAWNYIVCTQQRFPTMHGTILCSHHSVVCECVSRRGGGGGEGGGRRVCVCVCANVHLNL